ncbi:hypothetical protein, partial [Oceanibaculum pacificum]|uniref:hypothetical protein n=1 Tax=Oceanibaculum pacificum TaxID=580166 RepID=UPI0012EDB180
MAIRLRVDPLWKIPVSPPVLEDALITPYILAQAAGLVRARCRSGRLQGFLLTRVKTGTTFGLRIADCPALIAVLDDFQPGLLPPGNKAPPGERLAPTHCRRNGKQVHLSSIYRGPIGPRTLDRAGRITVSALDPDWRR